MNSLSGHRRRVIGLLAAGAVLRGLLIWFPRSFDDDTNTYTELGTNLLRHGVYGIRQGDVIAPSLIRLPGYSIFLGLFVGHLQIALIAQAVVDLLGCWLLYRFAARHVSERAGEIVLALSTLCIFTAAYAATGLAESLSVFAVSLGIYVFGELQRAERNGEAGFGLVALLAAAAALAIVLRPDGILLFAAILIGLAWYGRGHIKSTAKTASLFAMLALLPLVPWTVRNWRVFHVVQPLAPMYANNPGERVNYGFIRWFRTWALDFTSTGNIYWNLNNDVFDIGDLPARAFDSAAQYGQTDTLFDAYNEHITMTPALDAAFGRLADERVAARPLRYYAWLPALRVADMWLRPRTAAFNLDVFWWWWRVHLWQSAAAIGLGLLNLAYLAVALAGVASRRAPYPVLLISYVAMRSLMLALVPASEPRYTLEAYPFVILCAGVAIEAIVSRGRSRSTPRTRLVAT